MVSLHQEIHQHLCSCPGAEVGKRQEDKAEPGIGKTPRVSWHWRTCWRFNVMWTSQNPTRWNQRHPSGSGSLPGTWQAFQHFACIPHGIREYLHLEGIQRDHRVQLPAQTHLWRQLNNHKWRDKIESRFTRKCLSQEKKKKKIQQRVSLPFHEWFKLCREAAKFFIWLILPGVLTAWERASAVIKHLKLVFGQSSSTCGSLNPTASTRRAQGSRGAATTHVPLAFWDDSHWQEGMWNEKKKNTLFDSGSRTCHSMAQEVQYYWK